MAEASDLPALVKASIDGDEAAWGELVLRHVHLVMAVVRPFRLSTADAQDVSQTVWLRLVEHLANIREPAALPSWIARTTKHECLRVLRSGGRSIPVDPLDCRALDDAASLDLDADLLEAERHQALRDGLAELAPRHRELLEMLAADPPATYLEISTKLGIPIGSIGPTRSRVLEKLRATIAIRTYLESAQTAVNGGGQHALPELE